ncbi:CatB-related O-acetyltransferase [Acidisoma silvae]|uniref:CatB-related O-acetyltransferase n=2 Tax=Acidisoma silvae TaxID=2802396 RepID=A0A963YN86_9PROT|nr:CatB-related O-acetyltransferase [Acidisoma silvae]
MSRFSIGKYCSIAGGVIISLGNHRTDTFTTYPFKSLKSEWKNIPDNINDHSTKGDVCIGNDVWIGSGAFIGSGVSIGDGAVIGAKAVVVKDVPAYGIAVGNPARVARSRFDQNTIERLLNIRWWELPHDSVESIIPALMSKNSSIILDEFERIRSEIDLLHSNVDAK